MEYRVETIRYRYRKEWTGRQPSYTIWKLYVNNEEKTESQCGIRFMNVNQFIKHCKNKYDIKQDVIKSPAVIYNLGFNEQNY
jgi:hypothetical protein